MTIFSEPQSQAAKHIDLGDYITDNKSLEITADDSNSTDDLIDLQGQTGEPTAISENYGALYFGM